ncbi:MAG: hypothetical protein JW971_02980 [Synergistales bacterium]|nr:hypothetical protein [Synergistales bacterium]
MSISSTFDYHAYMKLTKVQAIFWSLADILMILVFLWIVDLLLRKRGGKISAWRYLLLLLSALMTPMLLLAGSSRSFFLMEAAIFAVQYLLLIYTLIRDGKSVLDVLLAYRGQDRADHLSQNE